MLRPYRYLLFLPIFLFACNSDKERIAEEKPVARVYDDYLYPSDLSVNLPQGLGVEDSIRISRRLTEEWISNRLLLRQAENHLTDDQQDIEKQIEEYRSSLLIFKYKQKLLLANIDSLISDEEILSYYHENDYNYLIDEDIVQAAFLKIPFSSPRISEVRRWYRSDREEDLQSLREYCSDYAESWMLQDSSWVHFSDLIRNTPLNVDNVSSFLNYNQFIETNDNNFYYFIRIYNRKQKGELKPLSMVKNNIKTVLLNKRKIEYLENLENEVYRDGISRNQVELFK